MCFLMDNQANVCNGSQTTVPALEASRAMKPIKFYTSRITPYCRAVQMVVTHLNIPVEEINMKCYVDTRTEEFRKVRDPSKLIGSL